MNIERNLQNFEYTMNGLGYIPVISTLSGPARMVFGKIEAITGLAIAVFASTERRSNWGLELALHGAANILRGTVETIPVIGNIACVVKDLAGTRFEYSGIVQPRFHHA